MQEVTLQQLLEAGCHFGHKSERWHPRAADFIYTEKDGIHIIDLAKTKAGLDQAAEFVRDTAAAGGEVLVVATKRQARGVVKEIVKKYQVPFFTERWIGGFLTNWDSIRKNIDKALKMAADKESGAWKKYVKHEQVQMGHHLNKLNSYYEGVLNLKRLPQVLFVIDVKKEISSIREAQRIGIPIIGVVDTNSNPSGIDYIIPANDDAIGSIQILTEHIAEAYAEGKKIFAENDAKAQAEAAKQAEAKARKSAEEKKARTDKTVVVKPVKPGVKKDGKQEKAAVSGPETNTKSVESKKPVSTKKTVSK